MKNINNSRYDRILKLLNETTNPVHIELINESDKHAGHRPADEGPETHFHLVLVSSKFEGVSRIDRSRMINNLLIEERDGGRHGGLHAFSMKLMAPNEWKN